MWNIQLVLDICSIAVERLMAVVRTAQTVVFAWLAALSLAVSSPLAIAVDDCQTINTISINAHDIFEADDDPNFAESALNFLHFTTRQHTISRELLFATGDCVNLDQIAESERNLRAMGIFASVAIRIVPGPTPDTADIEVNTKDRFTLRVEASASQTTGETKQRLSFGEKNLFGLGKSLHYSETLENDIHQSRFVYRDNRLFGVYALSANRTAAHDGVFQNYELSKPFRSLDDTYAYSYQYGRNDQNLVYLLGNQNQIDIPQLYESQMIGVQKELGNRSDSFRLGVQLDTSSQKYFEDTLLTDLFIPSRLEKIDLKLRATIAKRNRFLVMQGVDSLIAKEDIEIGREWFVGVGTQWRSDDEGIKYHPKLAMGYRQTDLLFDKYLISSRFEADARLYHGELMEFNSTIFTHGYLLRDNGDVLLLGGAYRYRYGKDLLNEPLGVGGNTGLRGYGSDHFAGIKSLLFNIEYRQPLPWHSGNYATGHSFFADMGGAWAHGESIRTSDMGVNLGWGLRLDVPSLFGDDILRVDLAIPLDDPGLVLSVTLGQVFSYNALTENTQKTF